MKIRVLSVFLAVILAIVVLPISSFAISSTSQYEVVWFPAPVMNLSQIAYEAWTGYGNNTWASHGQCNAIDILPGGDVFAPFTGKIVYLDANWGYVLLQSTNKVHYADGSTDYITVAFMHDSNISNLYVGQIISQGTAFYQAGGMGGGDPYAYGSHVDISVYRGQVNTPPDRYGRGDTYAYDAFYVNYDRTTAIYNAGNMENNNYITNGGHTSYDGLWKNSIDALGYLAHCTVLPACCLVKTTDKTYAMTLPCSSKTDSESTSLFAVEKGQTLAATELILNDQGNYWYKIQFSNDTTGYIPASKTSYQKDGPGQIEISGVNNPTTLTPGRTFSIAGTITSNFNQLVSVAAYVCKGHGTDGEVVTGGSDSVSNNSYSLARSTVDNQVRFDYLSEGNYTYVVEAEYINYYAVNEKEAASNTRTIVLHEAYFTVAAAADTSTPGKPILKTSIDGSQVRFSWGNTANTTHYNVWIQQKDVNGKWVDIELVFYAENGFSRTLPYGEYRAQLLSYNSNAWESDGSDWRHTWADDVCFKISECSHSYDNGKVTKEPNCTEYGVKAYTCTVCGETKTESIAKLTYHSYDGGKVTKKATCKEKGVITYTCTVCGETMTNTLAKLTDHSYDSGKVTKKATCKEAGVKTYTCTVCGATKTETIAKLTNHSYDNGKVTKAATCKDTGVKTYTCTVCGAIKTETIAKLTNHSYDNGKVTKAATCKDAGVKTYTCTVCGAIKTETIAKLTNHSYDNGKVTKEATCKEGGVKTYTCTVCKETKTEKIAKLTTHTPDAAATETTAQTCTVCGHVIQAALGHTHHYESNWSKDASTHWHACACGEKKDSAAHSWDSGKVTKAATCKEAGVKTYTCTVCKETKTEKIAKLTNHSWDNGTQNGDGTVTRKCTVCGKSKVEGTPTEAPTIPATTVAPTTVPPTTVAPTIVPETTVAPTTVPEATTAPTTIPPETSAPATTPVETMIPTETRNPTTPTSDPKETTPAPDEPADKQNEPSSSAAGAIGVVTATGGGAAYLWFFQKEFLLKLLKKLFKKS